MIIRRNTSPTDPKSHTHRYTGMRVTRIREVLQVQPNSCSASWNHCASKCTESFTVQTVYTCLESFTASSHPHQGHPCDQSVRVGTPGFGHDTGTACTHTHPLPSYPNPYAPVHTCTYPVSKHNLPFHVQSLRDKELGKLSIILVQWKLLT